MRVLVFGATGQVATELGAMAPYATFLDRAAADLTDPEACGDVIATSEVDAVINAAAYTAVDGAETDRETAFAVNGAAPGAMARACAAKGLPFVTISTDYVFDGAGTVPFEATHPTAPLGVYGASKLAGETAVRAAGGTFAILRTSWVFSAHGTNFVKTMLRLAQTRDKLTIVADQIGGPTPAVDIARACLTLVDALDQSPDLSGVYHFSGAPEVSWADFAREIFRLTGSGTQVEDIPTSAYPTPAVRPLNSRLDCATTDQAFGIGRPDWRSGLVSVLDDIGALP